MSSDHELFSTAVRKFTDPCENAVAGESESRWPRKLQTKRVQGALGVDSLTKTSKTITSMYDV